MLLVWHARLSLREAADVRTAHVPPRCKGGRNAHVNGMLGSLQQRVHCLWQVVWKYLNAKALLRLCAVDRTWHEKVLKTASRSLQNPAGRYLKPTKIEPGGTHESPDATKSAQHASKRRPRDAQECPKAAQKLPKSAPDAPKKGPGDSQTLPKTSPASSKAHLWRDHRRQPR